MANILLIEPKYKCKQPPLGLMKISYFHKNVMHDYVRFTKGELPPELAGTKWDRVYVTTLFTFEWKVTIEAIEYAKTLVDSIDKVSVGGIAATLLPEQMREETGIMPICGLLNEPGKLGLPGDECIDQIVPDYSMLDDIDYVYPFHDAYFLSATKGCGNRCGFCAVQTLEPTFVPYINIKDKIKAIDEKFGPKKDLILMDNNVLRSPQFDDIIDDIIAAGFAKGATYKNPRTGKVVQRYVDFNQGLDALFLNEAKAKRLGEIALRPARVAFDHIEDRDIVSGQPEALSPADSLKLICRSKRAKYRNPFHGFLAAIYFRLIRKDLIIKYRAVWPYIDAKAIRCPDIIAEPIAITRGKREYASTTCSCKIYLLCRKCLIDRRSGREQYQLDIKACLLIHAIDKRVLNRNTNMIRHRSNADPCSAITACRISRLARATCQCEG